MRKKFFRFFLLTALAATAAAQEQIYVERIDSRVEFATAIAGGSYHPSTTTLALTSADRGFKVVHVRPWKTVFTYGQLPAALAAIRFFPDGQMVTARTDGQVNLWNTQRGQMTSSMTANAQGILDAGLASSGTVIIAGLDNTLTLFDAANGKTVKSVSVRDDRIFCLAVHPSGTMSVAGFQGQALGVYDSMLVQTQMVRDLRESPTALAFDRTGSLLATGGIDGTVRLFDVRTWTFLHAQHVQRGRIVGLDVHPANRWMTAVSADSSLAIYEVPSLAVVKYLSLPDAGFTFAAFAAEDLMVTGDTRGRVMTWKVLERPPDTTAPAVTILQPARYSEEAPTKIYASEYQVFGLVYDESDIARVTIGERTAELRAPQVENPTARDAGLRGMEFRATVPLAATGMNRIEVRVSDASGNTAVQPLFIRRLSASEAIEILEPADRAETERVAVEVEFKPWFEVASYSISANTVDILERRGPLRIRPGENVREEVPLIVGYNQIGITVTGKKGERFTKLLGVTRKFSAAVAEAIRQPSQVPRGDLGPQRWAVVVGISEYANKAIPNLKFADRDAEAVAAFLQSPEGGSFDKDHMRVLINENATLSNLRDAMIDFLQQAIDKDLVLIYFAGHGAPDPTRPQNLYLLTHDTDPSRLGTTAFPMWDIQTVVSRQIQAKKVVVLSDACHSGGISVDVATRGLDVTESNPINQYLAELSRAKEGMVVFTASAAGEVSQEFPELGHGVFTYYLLEGLKGAADLNNDHLVTVNELMGYVEEQVKRKTRGAQNPTRSQTTYDKELPMSVLNK